MKLLVVLLLCYCMNEISGWRAAHQLSGTVATSSRLFSTTSPSSSSSTDPNTITANKGQVIVCTNKYCREKGSDSTMATFTFLTPQSIPVVGINCLGRCNKGPNVRILTPNGASVEASTVRSVEKVVELLQNHLALEINVTSADVLRLNYEGNIHLRNGELDRAINCYDRALDLDDKEQEGVLLVMRGTALLQRAYACRMRHKDVVSLAEQVLPGYEGIYQLLNSLVGSSYEHINGITGLSSKNSNKAAKSVLTSQQLLNHRIALNMLARVSHIYHNLETSQKWAEIKSKWPESREGPIVFSGDELLSRATFAWSLYEHSLLRSLQDLLSATVLLPEFAQAWRRAGEALSEIRLYQAALEYYEVAMQLDDSLVEALLPSIEKLKVLDRLVVNAESKGWPAEAILSLIEE